MKRAGLPLSVGQATLAMRVVIAVIFAVVALLCIGGGIYISTITPARVLAVFLVIPIGLIGAIAVPFVLAPHSRFGDWLDRFVPRLRERRIAIITALTFWLLALALTLLRSFV